MSINIRRGISYIVKRYAKANNKCMKNCNPTKRSLYISYLDMNNLYAWTMTCYVSSGG